MAVQLERRLWNQQLCVFRPMTKDDFSDLYSDVSKEPSS